MKNFKLVSDYKPSGDQPQAINKLIQGLKEGKKHQVLLGVTGSGKTFTLANVIQNSNRPALVISHNKTLASQLYNELKELFPENKVEYFVSYFDYYRPESYLPKDNLFIEKSSTINKEIESMRISAFNSLLNRRDTIVVASVAAIYGAFNPHEYKKYLLNIYVGMGISIKEIKYSLVQMGYQNKKIYPDIEFGEFSAYGSVLTICPGYKHNGQIRIEVNENNIIESIKIINSITKDVIEIVSSTTIFPCTTYIMNKDWIQMISAEIKDELSSQLDFFKSNNKLLEYERLNERINADIASIEDFGYTKGMENYSRYLDRRLPGQKPYTMFDYLPKDAVIYIDESHLLLPQLEGMYLGDKSRKDTLVEYGYRLPSALDNRPLKYEEFFEYDFPRIYMSATPSKKREIEYANGEVITQIIRPTGLLDPEIEIMLKENQQAKIYDLLKSQIQRNERTLILTLTKESAEEFSDFLKEKKFKSAYIHHELEIFERNAILAGLRMGKFDVVIGINLLKEGIDLPEVSLIIVLDADLNGFSRDTSSLIQIVGRAARNDHGKVVFFADKVSEAMKETIDDNLKKREIQIKFNKEHNIIPKTVIKPIPKINVDLILNSKFGNDYKLKAKKSYINELIREMQLASKKWDFAKAQEIKDLLFELGYDFDKK
ncbi:excinuclease ABC subunit UvrB [Mycoplasma sp. 1781]